MSTASLAELEGLERLAFGHGARAWRLAVSLMGNASDADDVMQQAYITVARRIKDLPTDDPWPWFCAVVVNTARNARRVRGRASDRYRPLGETDPSDQSTPSPSRAMEMAELSERLRAELDTLPDDEREALILTHLSGLTHTAAAETLRIPVGTLKSTIRRGVARLRARLGVTETSVACGLPFVAVESPVGGFAVAARRWISTAQVAAESSAASGILARLMPSRMALAASAVSLVVGLGGGWLVGISDDTRPLTERMESRASADPAGDRDDSEVAGAEDTVSPARFRSPMARTRRTRPVAAAPVPADLAPANLAGDSAGVDGSLGATTDAGSKSAGAADPLSELPSLPVPHSEWEKVEALRRLDWDNLGRVFNEYQNALEAVLAAERTGRGVSSELRARLASAGVEMERNQLRSLSRLIDGLPTSTANGRGEWTHPAVMANLMAARLQHAGLSLSEEQIEAIFAEASRYDSRWAAQQDRSTAGQTGVSRVLTELELKDEFSRSVQAVLTPQQSQTLASDQTRNLAGLDPLSPANMVPLRIAHNDVAANTELAASRLLMDRVAADLGVPRNTLDGYEYVFEQWVRDSAPSTGTNGIPGAVSTDDMLRAGTAQNTAYQTLQSVAPQNTQLLTAIQTSTTVFVPRITPDPITGNVDHYDPTVPGVPAGAPSPAQPNPDGTEHLPGEESVAPAPVEQVVPPTQGPVEQFVPAPAAPKSDPTTTAKEGSTVADSTFAASGNRDSSSSTDADKSLRSKAGELLPSLQGEAGDDLAPWKALVKQ